jgi:2-polyprenyl-3-methyl-5-hydroxy-6-metoxy-1,4-benzoquinol methylase
MSQQDQTKQYFRSAASNWQTQSVNLSGSYSVISGRNCAVVDVIERMEGAQRFLDVGCGTGQLVVDVARRGLQAEGIDFAAEMIAQCEANAKAAGVAARFTNASFFDAPLEQQCYDIISAQGFIEYISPAQTDEFLLRCFNLLRPGGSIALGSRNRLFNIFSLNAFTRMEAEIGILGTLIAEATVLHESATVTSAFEALRRYERIDPQPDQHPATGIPVATRYQFSPAELAYRLRQCGLAPVTLYPVHFHGLPPALKSEHPQLHSDIASIVGGFGLRDHRLVPFSSTFVIEARRAE